MKKVLISGLTHYSRSQSCYDCGNEKLVKQACVSPVIYLFLVSCLLSLVPAVYADYVLPYPSYMPGNKIYRISRFVDALKTYWYWGNIAQTRYHLSLSDKYLVEAKTLFEYNQYLLAANALSRSDKEFSKLPEYLANAKKEKKDIAVFQSTIQAAAEKHSSVLSGLISQVPDQFTWTSEKEGTTQLFLSDLLRTSIDARTRTAGLIY